MMIPLRNSLEVSWTALRHCSEGLDSILQYLIMLAKSLIYHIMPPNKLSIKSFFHLRIILFLFLSFLGMSAAFQSPPWAESFLEIICIPDEIWCSLKCPCLPYQAIQLSGILILNVLRAKLVIRSAGIVPVIKKTSYCARGRAFLRLFSRAACSCYLLPAERAGWSDIASVPNPSPLCLKSAADSHKAHSTFQWVVMGKGSLCKTHRFLLAFASAAGWVDKRNSGMVRMKSMGTVHMGLCKLEAEEPPCLWESSPVQICPLTGAMHVSLLVKGWVLSPNLTRHQDLLLSCLSFLDRFPYLATFNWL